MGKVWNLRKLPGLCPDPAGGLQRPQTPAGEGPCCGRLFLLRKTLPSSFFSHSSYFGRTSFFFVATAISILKNPQCFGFGRPFQKKGVLLAGEESVEPYKRSPYGHVDFSCDLKFHAFAISRHSRSVILFMKFVQKRGWVALAHFLHFPFGCHGAAQPSLRLSRRYSPC